MPRAVLWDVGNVIVRWDPRSLYSKIFPDPAARDDFLANVCSPSWHSAHDFGAAFEDTRKDLIARHPHLAAEITAWGERFIEMLGPPIDETVAAMDALAAAGVTQYGLTNMPQSKWGEVQGLSPAFRHLRSTVVSGEVQAAKPEPAIFQIVLDRTGLEASNLLFIDDMPENIEAARGLGFDVHRFDDPAAIRPALEARGLL